MFQSGDRRVLIAYVVTCCYIGDCSKPMQIRGLEEQAAARGQVTDLRHLFFVERSIPGIKDRSGNDFVQGEEIGQQAALRAIELLEEAQAEVPVELICGLRVHDVNGVDPLTSGGAIELNAVVVYVLLKVLIGLQGEAKTSRFRLPLKGIHLVVIDTVTVIEVSIDAQPSEHLRRGKHADGRSCLEALADPSFVPRLM